MQNEKILINILNGFVRRAFTEPEGSVVAPRTVIAAV
jgi:hypothetical protein